MIEDIIKTRMQVCAERRWSSMIIAVDLHDTVINSDKYNEVRGYSDTIEESISESIYMGAVDALQYLSVRSDIKLYWYSGTNPDILKNISQVLMSVYGIKMDGNIQDLARDKPSFLGQTFEFKPCFDVLLDDKAGFNPEKDWKVVQETIKLSSINLPTYEKRKD